MTATIADTLTMSHSGIITRPLIGLIIAVVVTAGLFWIMQYLIATADRELNDDSVTTLLEFVRVERDEEEPVRPPKPDPLPKPEQQPPQPPINELDTINSHTMEITIAPVPVDTNFGPDDFPSNTEGDYLPIVKVAPIYPNRALSRGIEGSCVVEYTVTQLGTTSNPAIIKEQCSSSLFFSASIKAALKFKYKPRFINGEAVEVTGVRNIFTYKITE